MQILANYPADRCVRISCICHDYSRPGCVGKQFLRWCASTVRKRANRPLELCTPACRERERACASSYSRRKFASADQTAEARNPRRQGVIDSEPRVSKARVAARCQQRFPRRGRASGDYGRVGAVDAWELTGVNGHLV